MARLKKSKSKWQANAVEALRYIFFAIYLLGLIAIVYGARSIAYFQQDQESLRAKRVAAAILEKKLQPSPEPVREEAILQPEPLAGPAESLLPEGEHAAV